jgi:ribosomal protein S12 methylthiotransferase accessory factor
VNILLACPNREDCELLSRWLMPTDCFEIEWAASLLDKETLTRLQVMPTPVIVLRADGERMQLLRWAGNQRMCPICLELRATSLSFPEESAVFLRGEKMAPLSRPFLTPFSTEMVLSLLEVLMRSSPPHSLGYDLHLPTLTVLPFQLEPASNCPLCCAPADDTALAATLVLTSRPKHSPTQYRLKQISEIEILPLRYCNPVCGMFGRGFTENRYHGYHAETFGSFRSNLGSKHRTSWFGRRHAYSGSLTTGLLEAFERYAALRMWAKRCTVFGSYKDLMNDALDPRSCGVYDPDFIQAQPELTAFSEETRVRWVWGCSLTGSRPILVPLQLAYYHDSNPEEPTFVRSNSNGCATGSCLEEAVFFALLELIERDAFLIHWRARLSPAGIELDSVSDSETQFLIGRLTRAGLKVFLFDMRLDIPVPSIAVALLRPDQELGTLTWAMASNFHPGQALKSALAEAAGRQFGFQKRMQRKGASAPRTFDQVRTIKDHALFYGLPEAFSHAQFLFESGIRRTMDDIYHGWLESRAACLDLLEDVQHCIELLALAGLHQVVVVDQTTPEQSRLGLRAVRVIVPGLMPLEFGHGSCRSASLSRLFSVPVKLGLRTERLPVGQMNWAPHPFS